MFDITAELGFGVLTHLSAHKSPHMSLKIYLVFSMMRWPGVAKMSEQIFFPIVPVKQSSMMASILFNLFYAVIFKSTYTDL